MQHTGGAARQRRRVASALEPLARRLDADQLDVGVRDERMEGAHRVRSSTHARHDGAREAPDTLQRLRTRLHADDRLEVTHHPRVWCGSDDGADDVVRVGHIRHPVTDRLARGILERARPARDRNDARAHEAHPEDIERLAPHVLLAHVHDALEAEARAHRGRRDAVLPGSGLGDDAVLPHASREQHLPHRVVDLVRARVVEILALEQDACTNQL